LLNKSVFKFFMNILGINLSHDRSSALIVDGKIVTAIAEERLDKVKKSLGLTLSRKYRLPPFLAINYCLESKNLSIDDLDYIIIDHAVNPVNLEIIKKIIPIKNKKKVHSLPHPSHHLAHSFSTFFCSPFEEAAILVADVFGNEVIGKGNEAESGFYAYDNKITPVFKNYQILRGKNKYFALTYLYRFITLSLGFTIEYPGLERNEQLDEAGKTMALAAYGKRRKDWPSLVRIINGKLDTSNFYPWAIEMGIGKVENGMLIPKIRDEKCSLNEFHKDLARKIQEEFEKGIIYLANKLYKKTKSKNLCLAGGGFLNCIVNRKILENTPFENIFIQPAATDDGNAIGAALYGWHVLAKKRKRFILENAYLGKNYSDNEIKKALKEFGLTPNYLSKKDLLRKTAKYIAEGKIVGWFQGGAEFGPRALGHRSILADPRRPEMPELINKKVKHRESFRPYAPSILEEFLNEYFDLPCVSPFMLLVGYVKKDKDKKIPAVVHIDGTARIQTVNKKNNGIFYDLIYEFYQLTGIPLVLNTSFNLKGKPIIESPTDALDVFFNTGIDVLVLGNYLIDKNEKKIKKIINEKKEEIKKMGLIRKHFLLGV